MKVEMNIEGMVSVIAVCVTAILITIVCTYQWTQREHVRAGNVEEQVQGSTMTMWSKPKYK